MAYKIIIDEDALLDIQETTNWYNMKLLGLGTKFQTQVIKQINSLKKNPNLFANRYKNVKCCLVEKFPFLIHFLIDEHSKSIQIIAVIHTSRNPKIWENK